MNDIELNDRKMMNGKKSRKRPDSDYYFYNTEDEEEEHVKRKSVVSDIDDDFKNDIAKIRKCIGINLHLFIHLFEPRKASL
ncbi:hypothetical protein HHI36_019504 [Cryptolaemus montrouzieri]|uniref:Uncharacterized protein n=1 Tax=Cryptolaemus montrouzieri TaxID=559131 RepID=A0ABD2P378_9CUCU